MKLSIEHLSRSYGQVKALQDVTLILEPGIYALLGPNGSGKSTLMNILTDNLKADSGRIRYTDGNGEWEDVLSMGVRFREKLGFMPQYPGLYPGFTVYNFLLYMATLKSMGADLRGRAKQDYLRGEILRLLDAVELGGCTRRRISTLSGGMKQRLSLAQALLGDPRIIVLDEPTAGLDPLQRMAVRNLIARIALDRIVLIATHVVSDVESIAREAILLRRGEVIAMDSPAALSAEMEGRVWLIDCTAEEATALRARYAGGDDPSATSDGISDPTGPKVLQNAKVINIAPSGDPARPVNLRILADAPPAPAAIPATPGLEDYYLAVFGEMHAAR